MLPLYPGAPVLSPSASYAQPEALQEVAANLRAQTDKGYHPVLTAMSASHSCRACNLSLNRTQVVPGNGNPDAELCFVGEGPGKDEDLQGLPFVGAAGKLLDDMIAAMGLARSAVFITNAVRCRPPGNRTPEPAERETCRGYLEATLRALPRLRIAVLLGSTAARSLLCDPTFRVTRERGRWRELVLPSAVDSRRVLKIMPTLHPAYLLREPSAKEQAWYDLQQVMRELGLSL